MRVMLDKKSLEIFGKFMSNRYSIMSNMSVSWYSSVLIRQNNIMYLKVLENIFGKDVDTKSSENQSYRILETENDQEDDMIASNNKESNDLDAKSAGMKVSSHQ